jgi:hypothetical protein
MPALLPTLALSIELSPNLEASHTRERCPSARVDLVTDEGVRHVTTLRVDVESPHIDLPDAAVSEIDAADIIGRAIDEAAWLAELARLLTPGGQLRMRVPGSGPLAWYDTRNIYRYMTDIFGRGDNPDDTLPTGWNRHYAKEDIVALLLDAGFANIRIDRVGLGLAEAPQLAGLTIGNFLLGNRDTEYRLRPIRERLEQLDARIPAPLLGTAFAITAIRAHTEPDDPADDTPDNRPAPEIDAE